MKFHKTVTIGGNRKPFIIAEMSANHNGSLERALELVEAAALSGADAIKLQTYTAETMTLDLDLPEFEITDKASLWYGRKLYELYEEAHTPWSWHEPIFDRARQLGITPLSTPFDTKAVDFLENLGVEIYKIASFENIDIPLIRKAASTGKPVIISTGLASVSEISDAVEAARDSGSSQIVLLKTTSSYPADPLNSNILTIPHMRELFKCEVGLSDHTLGIGAALASVALGASVIEKHFTLTREDGGVDAAFSLTAEELSQLVSESKRAWESLGSISYGASPGESNSYAFRRSLYVVQDIQQGEEITEKNVRAIRPGFGLSPKYLDVVVGMRAVVSLSRGTALGWNHLREVNSKLK